MWTMHCYAKCYAKIVMLKKEGKKHWDLYIEDNKHDDANKGQELKSAIDF